MSKIATRGMLDRATERAMHKDADQSVAGKSLLDVAMVWETSITRPAMSRPCKAGKEIVEQATSAKNVTSSQQLYRHPICIEMNALANEIRRWIYTISVPWDRAGLALIKAAHYDKVNAQAVRYQQRLAALVTKARNAWTEIVDFDKQASGSLFDPSIYPDDPDDWLNRWSFTHELYALPDDSSDLRLATVIGQHEAQRLCEQRAEKLERAGRAAVSTVLERVLVLAERAADSLQDTDEGKAKGFHRTMMDAMGDVADAMPALNLWDDPEIEALGADLTKLARLDAKALKKDAAARAAARETAETLRDKARGLLS